MLWIYHRKSIAKVLFVGSQVCGRSLALAVIEFFTVAHSISAHEEYLHVIFIFFCSIVGNNLAGLAHVVQCFIVFCAALLKVLATKPATLQAERIRLPVIGSNNQSVLSSITD